MEEWMYRSTFSWSRLWLEVNGQLHAPTALLPGKSSPVTHWMRGWVDPRFDLEDVEKRKFLTLPGLDPSVVQPVPSQYADYAMNVPRIIFRIPMEDLAILFAFSSPRISLKVLLIFPFLPRSNSSFKPRILIPLMPSGSSWRLFPNVCPFWVLAQPCPFLVPHDSVPYAVQEWHGRSCFCRRRQTSCGTHRCPGSVSSVDRGALRLDAGAHTGPSVPQMFPLRSLP
jgi:hypothetical protein